jgi:hypothetical protein
MSGTIRIRLHNVPYNLEPGDPIECTVDGNPHRAEYVRKASMDPRFIVVRIYGVAETATGKLTFSTQLSMFGGDEPPFVDTFTVNDAPGRKWHRTASTGYWK